jgi:beta-fructofuranosidase
MAKNAVDVTAVREHRPSFHVSPPAGWLNDPNGPIHRDGRYHLFFQHNPLGPVWAPRAHWGHAVSSDLVRWTHLPLAFGPSPDGPDAGGCWSGCVVDDHGVPTAVYSGLARMSAFGAESVCLARGDDELATWRKEGRNPVLPGPPAGLELLAFRDPFVWREAGEWSMLMGAGLDRCAAVLLFRSSDLVDWRYDGVTLSRSTELETPVWTGRAWECPQLFPLGDRHVLIVSVWDDELPHTRYAVAFVGDYREGRFEPERVARFDHGADCYAPATMADAHGRRLVWAWSWEARDEAAALEQGWAGVLTLPRVLSLTPEGSLGIAPAPELASLRGERETFGARRLDRELVPHTRGDVLELAATVAPGSARAIRLAVRATPDGEEHTTVEWDRATNRLSIDRSRSSLDPRAEGGSHGGVLDLAGGDLELRVFVDRSILEVYANGRFTLTERIYPTREDSTGVALSAIGGNALVRSFDVWELRSSPDP